ncbi:hypothetical protein LCGC14_1242960 [marine sediment metagenome]|uniref:Uncharacterized protein n=1 Tax=marine sediment metagenome TaxID=412755 RepID=A0A0F9LSG0_9ZZZZ
MQPRIELAPGVTLPPFLPTEALRYGRLSIAQVEYTFAPADNIYGLDELTIAVTVTQLAMVNLALMIDVEPGTLRLTMDPVGDVMTPFQDHILDAEALRLLMDKIADLHFIMTKDQPLMFRFRNITPYEIDMVLDVGASLVSEEQAEELREKRGPR